MIGHPSGAAKGSVHPLSLFLDDEGGYTTVALALALLLSITLVFFAGRVQWSLSRAAEVQEVADACSMAGSNVVSRYATCAQICDALILSMDLAGLVTCGAALILSAIPGAGPLAAEVLEKGTSILDARADFAQSAVRGLSTLEKFVPALVMLNSIAVVEANGDEGLSYAGIAVPIPLEGNSDFSSLATEIDTDSLEQKAHEMQEASERIEDARERANDALMRGWMADCGQRPRCMRERARTLAGLTDRQNPDYASFESWTFGAALVRARTYYPVRRNLDVPENGTVDALVDSCARKAFYDYAIGQLSMAFYTERADGGVDMQLPEFPHNTTEARSTSLYTDLSWPCTLEDGRVLHATLSCPAALGPSDGLASLAQLEAGDVARCETCQMDIVDMGRVAAASTNIDNGFEYYWREVVRASREYEQARNECALAEAQLKDIAREGTDLFEEALDLLSAPRPRIVPPGAWGCVALVVRTDAEAVPEQLGGAFLDASSLPAGAALSAAMLAPDGSQEGNSILAHLFDGLSARNPVLFGMLGDAGRLWGMLIESYGSSYDRLAQCSSDFLDRIDGVFGGSVGAWVRGTVKDLVLAAGLEPSDIRMLKPVLVSSAEVFEGAGLGGIARAQQLILALGQPPDIAAVMRSVGIEIPGGLGETTITIAELPVPGTDLTIPLEVDLSELAGAP